MAKKIDIKRTLGSPTPSFSVDAIEEMTRMIHARKEETAPAATPPPVVETAILPLETPVKKAKVKKEVVAVAEKAIAAEPVKRGRKPNPPATDERMIRVSVDLPESVFIKLKVKVIQEKTDMKSWAWRLIEDALNK